MILCHYLTPKGVIILKPSIKDTKDGILSELVYALAEQNKLKNPNELLKNIMEREASGSTFLPTGIAIPHARVEDVSEITLVMGVIPDGFRETEDASPTYIVLLFFSPIKDVEFGRHLKLLAKVAAVFRDPEFVKQVANTPSAEEIFSLLQHKERKTAE